MPWRSLILLVTVAAMAGIWWLLADADVATPDAITPVRVAVPARIEAAPLPVTATERTPPIGTEPEPATSPATSAVTVPVQKRAPVPFELVVPTTSKLAREVVDEMVATMKGHRDLYLGTFALAPDSSLVASSEYLFAIWPDLTRLLESGQITAEVHRAPEFLRRSHGTVSYAISLPDKTWSAAFHTPGWGVSLRLHGAPPHPELLQRIFDAEAAAAAPK